MPHPSTKFDDQCFYKRQDQWPWLSNRPFLWSYQLTKVSFITLNTSTLKEKNTYVLLKKDLTVQVQISHHTQARFKLPILSFGGQSNALWVALWEGHVEALIWLVHKIHVRLTPSAEIGPFSSSLANLEHSFILGSCYGRRLCLGLVMWLSCHGWGIQNWNGGNWGSKLFLSSLKRKSCDNKWVTDGATWDISNCDEWVWWISNTLHALNQFSIMSMEIIWFYQFI